MIVFPVITVLVSQWNFHLLLSSLAVEVEMEMQPAVVD